MSSDFISVETAGEVGRRSSDDDVVVRVENLGKCFHIYDLPRHRLQQFFLPRIQRMAGLTVKDYYKEYWALRNVSFELKKGETVGIVGKNGSGKSTLLQLICGTLAPTQGSVQTTGRIAALLELGSGFNPEFTGLENVYLNGSILGISHEEIDKRLDEILAFADIGNFVNQPVKSYSSGMAVRLAFAVQTVIEPDLFIVDEALAVGDEKFQRKCFSRLEKLKDNGTSILFVSHSAGSVTELCDKAVLLNEGEKLLYSGAAEVIKCYQRLIYAPPEKYVELLDDYRRIDAGLPPSGENSLEATAETREVATQEDEFDPGLKPESTIEYPPQGAVINSLTIENERGETVNVLTPGREYRFIVEGEFQADRELVYFGTHIKTLSGLEVTGQRFPEDTQTLSLVKKGKKFRVVFSYIITLQPGVYFAGCGLWSNAEPNNLHRIIDAVMFRVVSAPTKYSFGYCDLMGSIPQSNFG